MRARGAHITDLVVLVVAADEGVMQQTEEAIDHARAAGVPILVALNKIDRRNADIDRVKKELSERDLMPEDWGGKTVVAPVSAVTGEGVDSLLEMILLEAELLELKTNYEKSASGIVVEAHLSGGKGAVTTLIVQSGTLREGDILVVGPHLGKVKAMFDDHKRAVKEAGPSMPVEILGLSHVPEAGEAFYVVADEKQAKEITSKREEDLKNKKLHSYQKISLEDLYSQIQQGVVKELSVIIKADVQGSLEALKDSLEKIPSDKVKLKFIHLGVGDINASDVVLAVASKAIIIGFHVGVDPRAKQELEKKPVDVRHYRIIYDAVNDIKNALEGMLEAKTRKKFLSRIEIREVFKLSKHGIVAGCFVVKGKVNRKVHVDVLRNDAVVYSGVISSLKRFKDDVRDVAEGMECGISVEGFDKYQVGDIIEAYEIESIAQKL
ncbi:MAG: translation initiation factor IF-2 [Omnitrophica WOR_2 bacterium GWC2_45_7]|nr:MAG: translation initiation factor IF-2 [Omnitrophica WOR_2 bacterium GWC2_45_7]